MDNTVKQNTAKGNGTCDLAEDPSSTGNTYENNNTDCEDLN